MTALRYRGEFYPLDPDFSPKTHAVIVAGKQRNDYLVERDDRGRKVVIEGLTYDELCDCEIKPHPRRKSA